MNDNIGVGIIVGLAIGSSTYIWNSENFTKSQKRILLFFIIFPPLQWISAIVLYIYNKQQFQKTNFAPYIIIALLSIILISVVDWDNVIQKLNLDSYNQESISDEPATDISTSTYDSSNRINRVDVNNIYQKKFVYVVTKVEIPKLDVFESVADYDVNTGRVYRSPNLYSTVWKESVYTTDIIEIENYNEDEKFKLLDQTESKIRDNFSYQDMNYQIEVDTKCTDYDKKSKLKENKSQIINSEVYVFDSYAEASKNKRESNNPIE